MPFVYREINHSQLLFMMMNVNANKETNSPMSELSGEGKILVGKIFERRCWWQIKNDMTNDAGK